MAKLDYHYIPNVRSSLILTDSYVAGTVIGPTSTGVFKANCNEFNMLLVDLDFTIGSLTSCEVKVEFSEDGGTTYLQQTSVSVAAGVTTASLANYTISATGKYRLEIPISTQTVKISAKGTGTVTSSLLAVDAMLAVR